MKATGIRESTGLEDKVQKTYDWIKAVQEELGWDNPRKAYRALRATLHALRDRLTVAEAVNLGAELPMLVRGFYYEGWTVSGKPLKERHKEQFLEHIQESMRSDFDVDPDEVARAVFAVLARRISRGEIGDVKRVLPEALGDLWP